MKIDLLYSQEEIQNKINTLATQITADYKNKDLVVLGVLNGSFMFCADLIRKIDLPMVVDFISVSSYGNAMESSGEVELKVDFKVDIVGKDILLIEDIVDSGNTLSFLYKYLEKFKPGSVKVISLLSKLAKREKKVSVHYCGWEIEDLFVVGYGLDYAGQYRDLSYIGICRID